MNLPPFRGQLWTSLPLEASYEPAHALEAGYEPAHALEAGYEPASL